MAHQDENLHRDALATSVELETVAAARPDALDRIAAALLQAASLREVFARIADYPINRIDELLPWNVAKTLLERTELAA